jgi:hypothetical protein
VFPPILGTIVGHHIVDELISKLAQLIRLLIIEGRLHYRRRVALGRVDAVFLRNSPPAVARDAGESPAQSRGQNDETKEIRLGGVFAHALAIHFHPDGVPGRTWGAVDCANHCKVDFVIVGNPFDEQAYDIVAAKLGASGVAMRRLT